ncbi:replicative DNA helicase [Singulisphaera sp. PoT]|uniref:replicative DNA helicase n=1 Tax=Singulisphaera sp. PoT TaxID=3411797 RepID=UPI003BF48C58
MPPHSNYNGNGNSNGNGQGPGRSSKGGGQTPLTDRLPPQNIKAEQGVIAAALLDNEVLHDVVSLLKVDDFYRETHQAIYRVIRDQYDEGKAIDVITLSDELSRRGEFESIGGHEALVEILGSVAHAANAKYHATIVREKSVQRRLIESANEILRDGYSDTFTAEDLLEKAERLVFSIADDQTQGDTVELSSVVQDAMDRIIARSESRQPVTGTGTGYIDLDDMTGGFQQGQLIIVAARPSMGKTAFALNICEHAALALKVPVLFVSLEMGQVELAERLLCARSRVDGHKIRTGQNLAHRDLTQLSNSFNELRESPLFIDDTPSRNMLQITANSRRLKSRADLGLIVLDYIQLVDSDESRDSRQEQIAKISRRLKTLAREMKVPVIALSQLNRAVENREDRRPRMADLRESGAIEQDADMVLLLHRPEYYDPNDQPGVAELIVAKNRNGATGTVKLSFLRNIMRFENLAAISEPIDAGSF